MGGDEYGMEMEFREMEVRENGKRIGEQGASRR